MALAKIGTKNCNNPLLHKHRMPKLITRIEAVGNDVKTIVVNLEEVAEALDRPPAYIMQVLGYSVGAVSEFDEEALTGIVEGEHGTRELATVLEEFMNKFVPCKECKNLETPKEGSSRWSALHVAT
ncbi:hypothetical protein M758_5G075800 [Ceratodon purpureus]|nr:hypothetical protein M758_5G075800 [Ceratodon purpureus]